MNAITTIVGQLKTTTWTACLGVLVIATAAAKAQTLPASYDLRLAGSGGASLVPAIQDQSHLGDCWTFATSTTLDSALIKEGYLLPLSTTPPPIAVSSWHLSLYNGQPETTVANKGYGVISFGGEQWYATSYYTRGQAPSAGWTIPQSPGNANIKIMGGGPMLKSQNTLNAFPNTDIYAYQNLISDMGPVSQTPSFTVTGAYYLDNFSVDNTYQPRTAANQVLFVKQALMSYGAVSTYMNAGAYTLDKVSTSVFQPYPKTGPFQYEYAYYDHEPYTATGDHSVTIIGWNDNIVIPEPVAGNLTATSTGAWIVQNSWGTPWGGTTTKGDGTFYAPYNDVIIGQKGLTIFTATASGTYSPYVQENELGPTGPTGYDYVKTSGYDSPTGMGWIASPTQATSTPPVAGKSAEGTVAVSNLTMTVTGTLKALGLTSVDSQGLFPGSFPTPGGTAATITIYNGAFNGTTFTGTQVATMTVNFPQEGYTLFPLTTPLSVTKNEVLAVKVDYQTSSIPYVWQSASDSGTTPAAGLSYYQDANGVWRDFGRIAWTDQWDQYTGVFPVKGLMGP